MNVTSAPISILGAGYTGARVARILREWGHAVQALRRADIDFAQEGAPERLAEMVPPGAVVLHSIPTLAGNADAHLLQGLYGKAVRVVYLSTTGVYGGATHVDEHTPPVEGHERMMTERAVAQGPWSSLILRPAAIYGPDRGVHLSMAHGAYKLFGDGSNYISRIHVEDLARLAAAALLSPVTGAYPVADRHACTSREIAEWCASHFQLPPPVYAPIGEVPPSRRNNRQVDGRAICRLLGVDLLYPSYREGLADVVLSTGPESSRATGRPQDQWRTPERAR